MKVPPAPLSMRARVSTVSFSLFFIKIGIDKELYFAEFTEKMYNGGEVVVDAALHFKNPLSQLLDKIVPFRLHSFGW